LHRRFCQAHFLTVASDQFSRLATGAIGSCKGVGNAFTRVLGDVGWNSGEL
jgi:hypothetical protein